jgi:hypothetical protein
LIVKIKARIKNLISNPEITEESLVQIVSQWIATTNNNELDLDKSAVIDYAKQQLFENVLLNIKRCL